MNSTFYELDKLQQHGIHLDLVEVAGPLPIEYPKAVTGPDGIVFEVINKEEEDAVLAGKGDPELVQPFPGSENYPRHIVAPDGVLYIAKSEADEHAILAGAHLDAYQVVGKGDPFVAPGAKDPALPPPVTPPAKPVVITALAEPEVGTPVPPQPKIVEGPVATPVVTGGKTNA